MICFIRGCHATEEALKADVKEQQRLKNAAQDSIYALNDAVRVARNEADATRAELLANRAFSDAELAKVTEECNKLVNDNMVFQLSRTGYDSQIKESERRLAVASDTIDKRNEKIARLQSQIAYLESVINPDLLKDMPKDEEPVVSAYDAVPSESPIDNTDGVEVSPLPKVDSDCFQDDDGNLICSK